jgi:hypothetical protein
MVRVEGKFKTTTAHLFVSLIIARPRNFQRSTRSGEETTRMRAVRRMSPRRVLQNQSPIKKRVKK